MGRRTCCHFYFQYCKDTHTGPILLKKWIFTQTPSSGPHPWAVAGFPSACSVFSYTNALKALGYFILFNLLVFLTTLRFMLLGTLLPFCWPFVVVGFLNYFCPFQKTPPSPWGAGEGQSIRRQLKVCLFLRCFPPSETHSLTGLLHTGQAADQQAPGIPLSPHPILYSWD